MKVLMWRNPVVEDKNFRSFLRFYPRPVQTIRRFLDAKTARQPSCRIETMVPIAPSLVVKCAVVAAAAVENRARRLHKLTDHVYLSLADLQD